MHCTLYNGCHVTVSPQVEFIRGLLQEVETKVQADLTEVVYDDALMSHLIDELLIFDRELRMVLQYPCPCPTPFDVLLGEVPFHKWLSLEKACKSVYNVRMCIC